MGKLTYAEKSGMEYEISIIQNRIEDIRQEETELLASLIRKVGRKDGNGWVYDDFETFGACIQARPNYDPRMPYKEWKVTSVMVSYIGLTIEGQSVEEDGSEGDEECLDNSSIATGNLTFIAETIMNITRLTKRRPTESHNSL